MAKQTHSGAKILVAPAPPQGKKGVEQEEFFVQRPHNRLPVVRLHIDSPDGECPGYSLVEVKEVVIEEKYLVKKPLLERGMLRAYQDGTATLNDDINGITDVSISNNSVSSSYYPSNTIGKNSVQGSIIDDRPQEHFRPYQSLFIGTPGADVLDASQVGNSATISGQGGADTLIGSQYNDLIFGGFIGSTSSDRNWGSTISVDTGSNTIIGGSGNDTIIAGSYGDEIWGGDTANSASSGNNVIYSGGGKDTIHTGHGHNTVYLSDGSNSVTSSSEQALVNAGQGNDSIIATASGKNSINAGDGQNTINVQGNGLFTVTSGNDADSIVLSGSSSNSVHAGSGKNSIAISSSGNNTITSTSTDSITLNNGKNTLRLEDTSNSSISILNECKTNIETNSSVGLVQGSKYNDTIEISGKGTISLELGEGKNQVSLGNGGQTDIHLGNGQDTITVLSGLNKISGQSSSGISISASGDSTVTGTIEGNGNNTVIIQELTNIKLNLGNGNNSIETKYGAHFSKVDITTGTGNDTITIANSSTSVLNAGGGNNYINILGTSSLAGDLTITVGNGNDTITAINNDAAVSLTLSASGGNNSINLQSQGNKSITTGNGSDTIIVHSGNNLIQDSGGDNKVATGSGNDTILLETGNNSITSSHGDNNVTTGNGNDTILLENGNNVVESSGGNNNISTGSGNDTINVGSGQHTITTSGGSNSITLQDSTVKLLGGNGSDTLVIQGSMSGEVDLGNNNTDVLVLGAGANIHHNNLSISDAEVVYIASPSGYVSITQETLHTLAKTGANFYDIKLGNTVHSTQVLLSAEANFSGVINIDAPNTDPLILGSQSIPGVGTVYIVSISSPGTSGNLLLVPSDLMDNITINSGKSSMNFGDLIGSQYDQSNNGYISITQGKDNSLLSSEGALHDVASGNKIIAPHSIEEDDVVLHSDDSDAISSDILDSQPYLQASTEVDLPNIEPSITSNEIQSFAIPQKLTLSDILELSPTTSIIDTPQSTEQLTSPPTMLIESSEATASLVDTHQVLMLTSIL